jgi:hypothetical protein
MKAHADALPLTLAGEPRWRQAAGSAQDRCDVSEFDKCEIGRDAYPLCDHRAAYPPYDHRAVGIGSAFVASAWLAFYVIAAIHVASGN